MLTNLKKYCNKLLILDADVRNGKEKKVLVSLNKALIILLIFQILCLCSHLYHHLQRPAIMTAFFIASLVVIIGVLRTGHLRSAKALIIIFVNTYIVVVAFLQGQETHFIDFLLLTALLPLFFFELKEKRAILSGMLVSIVPLALYHFIAPYFAPYAMPLTEQLDIYKTVKLMQIVCLCMILYLIYFKYNEHEQVLTKQKDLYESILEQMPIGIASFDKELKYTYINSAAVKDPDLRKWMIGKDSLAYYKKKGMDLTVARERSKVLQTSLNEGTIIQFEEALVDTNGNIKYSIKGSAPIFENGIEEPSCLIGYSMDITPIKEAENKVKEYATQLEQKNIDLQRFVDITSHELKTPLRNITSYLQLIEKRMNHYLDEDTRGMMGYTAKAVKNLDSLIKGVYQYATADRQEEETIRIIPATKVLKETIAKMQGAIIQKNAVVNYTTLPDLKMCPLHLETIFSHLINNALKYNNSDAPVINIKNSDTKESYLIEIIDNGIGISKKYHEHVFELFRRLHGPEEYEGIGAGLAICKKIIEYYGGKIWIDSDGNKGSAIVFSLLKSKVATNQPISNHLIGFKESATSNRS